MKKLFLVVLVFLFAVNSLETQLNAQVLNSRLSKSGINTKFSAAAMISNVKVVALRVEFVQDENILTTGDGKFDYTEESVYQTDPTPHDSQYFLDHLEALKRYYYRVSDSKLELTSDLYPLSDRLAYQLPNDMAYYNPNTTEEELDQRLSELVADAIAAADSDIDFSQYDVVIIFHAGIGGDFTLDTDIVDTTPHDIPSVYLDTAHFGKTIGGGLEGYEGIPTNDGMAVSSVLVMPEAESKRDNEIGLNGVIAHQFGHHLGLPSLFNSSNGKTGIGQFGLMGIGFINGIVTDTSYIGGLIPSEPTAWSKVYLGWVDPVVVNEGTNLQVVAAEAQSGNTIYKVPITPTEYYLIENRQQDYNGDGLYLTYSNSGVLLEVDDYDFDIPGNGILIWHIDEKIIAAGLADNSVNADTYMRGVDLEEADGMQEIGEIIPGLLPGSANPTYGTQWDTYPFAGFESGGEVNSFTPETIPNTNSNSRAKSHIWITDISAKANVMTFNVSREHYVDGMPRYFSLIDNPVVIENSVAELGDVKYIIGAENKSYSALRGDFTGYSSSISGTYTDPFGNEISYSRPIFAGIKGIGYPALGNGINSANEFRGKFVTSSGEKTIRVYDTEANAAPLSGAPILKSFDLPSPLASSILLTDWIIVGTEDGYIRYYNIDGNEEFSYDMNSTGDIDLSGIYSVENFITSAYTKNGMVNHFLGKSLYADYPTIENSGNHILTKLGNPGTLMSLLSGSDGRVEAVEDNTSLALKSYSESFSVSGLGTVSATGDVNGDGYRNLVGAYGNTIFVLNRNGTPLTDFPFRIASLAYAGDITSLPLLADLSGDGRQDIVFGTSDGNVMAIDYNGHLVDGFPYAVSGEVTSINIAKSAGRDNVEIAVTDSDGFFYVFDTEITFSDKVIAWPSVNANSANQRTNYEPLMVVSDPESLRESGELMPKKSVYNWPNPNKENWTKIRYFLNENADVTVRIFTQIGELVTELAGPGVGGTDNELTWDLTGVQSGVYFAQVTAKSNGESRSSTKIIKIAVVK